MTSHYGKKHVVKRGKWEGAKSVTSHTRVTLTKLHCDTKVTRFCMLLGHCPTVQPFTENFRKFTVLYVCCHKAWFQISSSKPFALHTQASASGLRLHILEMRNQCDPSKLHQYMHHCSALSTENTRQFLCLSYQFSDNPRLQI